MTIPAFGSRNTQTIGLLGGSFNPAHEGHVHISELALKQLGLDAVWWLVSPQNPLKSEKDMASIEKRVLSARKIVKHSKIHITTLENQLRTRYTADTLKALCKRYPNIRFVWIMGADNLAGFHRWKNWQFIFKTTRIAIYHRPTYALKALSSQTAQRFSQSRLAPKKAGIIGRLKPPVWSFLPIRGKNVSATDIRSRSQDWL
jgi:nicotinate-nucleotide adenylyltransferase